MRILGEKEVVLGKVSLKQDSRGALQDTMNQGGIPRYFPQLDPGMVKYKID